MKDEKPKALKRDEYDLAEELRKLSTICGGRTVLLPRSVVKALDEVDRSDFVEFEGVHMGSLLDCIADMIE